MSTSIMLFIAIAAQTCRQALKKLRKMKDLGIRRFANYNRIQPEPASLMTIGSPTEVVSMEDMCGCPVISSSTTPPFPKISESSGRIRSFYDNVNYGNDSAYGSDIESSREVDVASKIEGNHLSVPEMVGEVESSFSWMNKCFEENESFENIWNETMESFDSLTSS